MAGSEAMGGAEVPTPSPENDTLQFACDDVMPYASEIISFEPGTNAGYGQSKLPDVVLGPPQEGPPTRGSLDVLSLGTGGEIVLGFGGYRVFNGPGPDFIVWENPFWIGGDAQNPFAELGEVAVSADGETWHAFPCNPSLEDSFDPGCAGWRPRLEFDSCELLPIAPELAGAICSISLSSDSNRFVSFVFAICLMGASPSAGFDLDAVGAVHLAQ